MFSLTHGSSSGESLHLWASASTCAVRLAARSFSSAVSALAGAEPDLGGAGTLIWSAEVSTHVFQSPALASAAMPPDAAGVFLSPESPHAPATRARATAPTTAPRILVDTPIPFPPPVAPRS